MTSHALAIIAGDGIGQEVMDQSLKALDAAERRFGFSTDRRDYDLGGRRYLATGEVLSDETLAELDESIKTLTEKIGQAEAELKEMTAIRDKEHAIFEAEFADASADLDICLGGWGIYASIYHEICVRILELHF